MRPTRILGLGALAGAATLGYALSEARAYTLREVTLPVLPAAHAPLRVLHVSDLHLTPGQRAKREFCARLADLGPDLVINTGDNLSHRDAVPVVLESFGKLLDIPGVFVFGSNDYFEARPRNPFRYLLPDDGTRHTNVPQLPWRSLRDGFLEAGWSDLTNRSVRLRVGESTFGFVGVDDPHLGYDDLPAVVGPAPADVDVRLAIAHAPYLRVLDQFAADGYDAIVAGHTHGGQVCLPWVGALTTNCDLDRGRARGLHRHPANSSPGDPGSAWLHVSAGLGTSPYARVRVACRPEATLMTFTTSGTAS